MGAQGTRRKLFIHETTHLRSGDVDRHVKEFAEHYQPLMERLDARLFGMWQGDPFNSHWPEVTTLWEIDGWRHYSRLGAARRGDPAVRGGFAQWGVLLGELGASGQGRLMYPNRNIRTLEQLRADGVQTTVCIQEVMTTKPGRQDAYLEQLEHLYVPWSERTGKKWVGSFTTYLSNEEVIHYWAVDGGWEGFAKYFPAWGDEADTNLSIEASPADIKCWMTVAPAVRDGWDDSILESLPPNPLG